MNRFVKTLLILLVAAPGMAMAEMCPAPDSAPAVPDGSTATKEEMVHAQSEIHSYLRNAQQYVDCVDENEDVGKIEIIHMDEDDRKARIRELNAARHHRNAVVESMQKLAKDFNTEIEKYQARQGGS